MPFRWNAREHLALLMYVVKWLLIAAPLGAAVGSLVALFLWLLDKVTDFRWEHPWILFLLPAGGVAIGLMYRLLGRSVEGGSNLIVEQIHEPGGGIPSRMAPLVLIGTIITHLFGGSAGREGTAVQMGGSLASTFCRWLRLNEADTRILLMAGVAAGFGAVFGTPLSGAVFAMEVLAIGTLNYQALIPCLAASIIGDAVTSAWGIQHSHYRILAGSGASLIPHAPGLNWLLLGKVAIAALVFGLASVLFSELAHSAQRIFKRLVRWPVLRPALGGLVIIALVYLVGTRDYLGLGVSADPVHPNAVTIQSCFLVGGATWWSWWWKILFTVVTISSGFKGGEVTPLFFIGAALGNVLARILGAPVDLFAGLGFVAVFAGAANTPLACTLMAVELFAPGNGELLSSGFVVYAAVACCFAYLISGHSGIYLSQRIGSPKIDSPSIPPDGSLREARDNRRGLGDAIAGIAARRAKITPTTPEVDAMDEDSTGKV
ncbi:MAG: voltage-gated chloride channel family protein [Planctomycetia bacterium]|nr:voltage-gated chloride channel family protein [Planctomycetia bacterium]